MSLPSYPEPGGDEPAVPVLAGCCLLYFLSAFYVLWLILEAVVRRR